MDQQGGPQDVTPKSGQVRLRLQTPAGRWVNVGPFGTLSGARRYAESLIEDRSVKVARVEHRNKGQWRPAWSYLVAALALTLILAGCATTTAPSVRLTDTQADLVSQWQAYTDRVLDHYGLEHVRLIVEPRPDTEGAMVAIVRSRRIIIDPRALNPAALCFLSHEIGHVLSGLPHGSQIQREKDANARAVEVLAIGRPVAEEAAFREMVGCLEFIVTIRAKLGTRAPRYHDACSELLDLEHRYAQYRVEPLPACVIAR